MQIRNGGKFSANIYILNPSPILHSPYRDFTVSEKNQYGKKPCRKNTESVKNRVGKTMTLNNKDSNKKIKTKKNNLTKGIKILK